MIVIVVVAVVGDNVPLVDRVIQVIDDVVRRLCRCVTTTTVIIGSRIENEGDAIFLSWRRA
jgi:hypothetical protein